MLASPGHSPRHIDPSPSPSPLPSAVAGVDSGSRLLLEAPPLKKRKSSQSVLDEDTYVAAIEKIVERDYFPDLPKLQNRLEWLEAIRSGDPLLIRDVQLKIQNRRRLRHATPATTDRSSFFTPSASVRSVGGASPAVSVAAGAGNESSAAAEGSSPVDTNMSLDQFLRVHTSEDNASFSKIVDKMNRKTREKYKHLLLEAPSPRDDAKDRVTDGYGSSNQPVSTLDSWKFQAKNLLMYHPQEEVPLTDSEREQRLKGLTREIVAKNTRFQGKSSESRTREEENNPVSILYTPVPGATPSALPFAERDAENARRRYDLEDLRRTPNSGRDGVGGYSFVRTPSPAPGVDESPFITWGDIEGTPLKLDDEDDDTLVGLDGSSSADGPRFKIPLPPSRDVKARDLSRIASRNLRNKSKAFQKPPRTPVRSDSPGFYSLSPAARKFVKNQMAKSGHSVDATLRASYRASTTPGTPKMAKNAVRFERSGGTPARSSLLRESSLIVRSPTPES